MARYPFLSDRWIGAARKIREEFGAQAPSAPPMLMNLIVTDVPFGTATMHAHVNSTSGKFDLDEGHLDNPEVTVSADYVTVRALLVDQDPTAAIAAFMGGRIRVQGDLGKLLALQAQVAAPDPDARAAAEAVAARIKAITAE